MSQGDNEMVLKAVETNSLNEKENMNGDHDEKYTVIRVKRKTTDDPERALTINSKKVGTSIFSKFNRGNLEETR